MAGASGDPITDRLLGPGGAFEVIDEIVDGETMRVFKNAPQNLASMIDEARRFGDAAFLVEDDTRLSYTDFFNRCARLASYLITEHGIGRNDVVAIAMRNRIEWMNAFCAIVFAGAIPALINSRAAPEAMATQASDADARMIIADERRLADLRKAGCTLTALLADDADSAEAERFAEALKAEPALRQFDETGRDDVACLFFTSGTTGRAKPAALTNRNIVTGVMNNQLARMAIIERMAAAYGVSAAQIEAGMPQASALLVFPLFHTSGCNSIFLTMLTGGGKIVLMPKWNAASALEIVAAERITSFAAVPTMLWDLLEAKTNSQADVSSLTSFSSGGQALPLNTLARLQESFPNAFIGAGYGMTETSGAVSQANGEEYLTQPQSAGRVLPMVDVRIIDEAGREAAIGETGEIHVKGAIVMKGYWDAERNSYGKGDDGWFATGDVGRLNDQGYLFIVDRKTDMLISGGENIYCAEVEQSLSRHPGIEEIVAFGAPDDRLGERLVVAVYGEVRREDIEEFARDRLAGYSQPSDIIVRESPFQRNAMGKVNKGLLREDYLNSIGASA